MLPVRCEVSRSSIGLNQEFTATCSLTTGGVLLGPYSRRIPCIRRLASIPGRICGVTYFGTYACRNVNYRERPAQQIMVNNERLGGSNAHQSAFLRNLRNGACDFFNAVLSPDYNEARQDDFNFPTGVPVKD